VEYSEIEVNRLLNTEDLIIEDLKTKYKELFFWEIVG